MYNFCTFCMHAVYQGSFFLKLPFIGCSVNLVYTRKTSEVHNLSNPHYQPQISFLYHPYFLFKQQTTYFNYPE